MSRWYSLTYRPLWWARNWKRSKVPMPSTQWSLKTFDTYQSFHGPVLFLPYTLPKPDEASASMRLLALEGWLGYGNVSESDARLLIPSQIIWPDNRSRLQMPL